MAEGVTSQRHRIISFIWVVLFVGAGAFFSVLLTQAVKERQRHEEKLARVEKAYQERKDRVEKLKLERDAVTTDPIYVEGVARESLNFAKPGEVTYQRENVKLRRMTQEEKAARASALSTLVEARLAQWQVPITILAVIGVALVIVRCFGSREEGGGAEDAQS